MEGRSLRSRRHQPNEAATAEAASIKQENAAEQGSQGSRKRGRAVKAENGTEESGEADTSQTASAEKEAGDGEEDGDDDWEGVKDSVDAQLTYEQQRQANIRRNLSRCRCCSSPPSCPPPHSSSSSSSAGKRKKVTSAPQRGRTMPTRRSLRNQGLDPEGNEAEIKEGEGRYVPELSQWVRPSEARGQHTDERDQGGGEWQLQREGGEGGDRDQTATTTRARRRRQSRRRRQRTTKAPRDATIDGLCATFKALAPSSNPQAQDSGQERSSRLSLAPPSVACTRWA